MAWEDQYPKHNKTHFYKYADIKTACLILQNKTWRFSSPSRFNDPFDTQSTLYSDCEDDVFRKTLCHEIEEIVLGKKQVNFEHKEGKGEAIVALRERYMSRRWTKEEAIAMIKTTVDELANIRKHFSTHYPQRSQKLLPRLRVFCVSEVKDSILMWSHYADYHKGVVFKLKVLRDKHNALCSAGRVTYDKKPYRLFTIPDLIDAFIGVDQINERKRLDQYIYHKNKIWDYEKEWRVWNTVTEKVKAEFTDYDLYPEEIEAVYFGLKASGRNKTKIMTLAREVNPNVAFFQGSKDQDGFGIVFNRI